VRVEGVGLRAAVLLLAQQPAQLRVIRSPLLPAVEDLRDRTPPRLPRQRLLLTGTWLGHQLHPMLTDVPIGSWVSAGVLDLTAGPAASRAAQRLVGFGVLAAIPTAASGASDWSESYGSEQRVGLVHALGNVGALSLQLASYVARRRGHRGLGIALGTVGTGLTAAAGYLGGTLTLDKGMGSTTRSSRISSPSGPTLLRWPSSLLARRSGSRPGACRSSWSARAARYARCPPPACTPVDRSMRARWWMVACVIRGTAASFG